jgi:hypothetical protein
MLRNNLNKVTSDARDMIAIASSWSKNFRKHSNASSDYSVFQLRSPKNKAREMTPPGVTAHAFVDALFAKRLLPVPLKINRSGAGQFQRRSSFALPAAP